jgi:hypothetical protein
MQSGVVETLQRISLHSRVLAESDIGVEIPFVNTGKCC